MARKPTGDYEVGYCRAPAAHRFKKGQSGNPRGRPKKPPDIGASLYAILRQKIRITENGKTKRISTMDALLKATLQQALRGDRFARRDMIDLLRSEPEPASLAPPDGTSASSEAFRGLRMETLSQLRQLTKKAEQEKQAYRARLTNDHGEPLDTSTADTEHAPETPPSAGEPRSRD